MIRGARVLALFGGISLGTTLRELSKRNGREFVLAGFGWDYGGVILDPGVYQIYLDFE